MAGNGNGKKLKVEEILPVLIEKGGNIAAVARKLAVARGTVYARIKESPTLQKTLEDSRERFLDDAESKLYEKVLSGNMTALIFFLKTQGKKRGYTERIEVDSNLVPVDVSLMVVDRLMEGIKTHVGGLEGGSDAVRELGKILGDLVDTIDKRKS
jgi:hypothetical protein